MFKTSKLIYLSIILFFTSKIFPSDSFDFNTFNNHGVVGLINMPTARFYEESSFGFTFNYNNPDQKITMTSFPFDWLEASFFYTNIDGKPYCEFIEDPVCNQDYKDKGFNTKLRLKKEGVLPALAIGINDIAGTGFYSSEYIVASYGINKTDIHFGLGWGNYNRNEDLKNPLIYLDKRFETRPTEYEDKGGQFQPSRYFSDSSVSPFFGISHVLNDKVLLKLERDTTITSGLIDYETPKSQLSFGIEFLATKNLNVGLAYERGNAITFKFIYKKDRSSKPVYEYKKPERPEKPNKYDNFIGNLESNGIGVNKIVEGSKKIGLEISQFQHPSLQIVDEIIKKAKKDSKINKEINTNYKIANLDALETFQDNSFENPRLIYKKGKARGFNTDTSVVFRPFIAGREGFLKFAMLLENDSEYIFSDNFFFSSNLKYSLWDNFDDLVIPPVDTYPAQVRSDVKDYLREFNDGIVIGRAQFDGYKTISSNNHLMFSAGIFEEMFSGFGIEYLHFKNESNHAYGFELFQVYKRDYEMQLGLLDYKQLSGHFNYYFRNYGAVPFDLKASYGKYLAGDVGGTIELSRTYSNGVSFGVFATFTDVSSDQFGEGSFDKGIFFNIPIFENMINYTWRPLTKDPGAKLIRKNNLHDLLVKFRPIN
tara:strand:+ start:51294 stop:53249 length:1956 start_codon:yes stop_codon:yes gene_type:complete